MLIPNQYFEIKVTKANMEHYKQLGYDVDLKDIINVPAEHLTKGSHHLVTVKCDFCEENISKEYKAYLINHTYGLDSCEKCINEKAKITLHNKYGVCNAMDIPGVKEKIKSTFIEKYGAYYTQTDEFKEKSKNTCLKRYGVENSSQAKEIKEKIKNTNLNKYGTICPLSNKDIWDKAKVTLLEKYGVENASQSKEIKDKIIKKCLEKYGVKNPSSSKEIREKVKSTCLERYGVKHIAHLESVKEKREKTFLERYGVKNASQVPEFREKVMKTMSQNGTAPTSSQQILLYNMIKSKYNNSEINYPFSNCCLDIFICEKDIKIDIEYDGWYWHQDKYKDVKRDKFLQKNGFKILRIRSGHLLPTEEQLFEAIEELITTDRKFKEIILDDWKEGEELA